MQEGNQNENLPHIVRRILNENSQVSLRSLNL